MFARKSNYNTTAAAAAAASTGGDDGGSAHSASDHRKPPKAINIRTLLTANGLIVRGLPKNKTLQENEVKLPLLWRVHNDITNQDRIQTTNFLIGDTSLKVANQVSKKPGPFSTKDARGKITTPQPNKFSMLVRIGDEEMIKVFRLLDQYIVSKIQEGNLLADYRVPADKVEECYKPFLIENGSGDYSISTSFNVNADGTADDKEFVEVKMMIMSRDPVTGDIRHEFKPATVEDIRMGDSVIIEGGFDGIRLDKMSPTPGGLPRIGFKHYSRRIIVVRTEDDMGDAEEDDDESFLMGVATGKTLATKPSTTTESAAEVALSVGEKRARSPSPTPAIKTEGSASSSSFFKRS